MDVMCTSRAFVVTVESTEMGRNIFGLDLDAVNVVAVSLHMTRKRGPPLGGGSGRGSKKTFRPYIRVSNPDSPLSGGHCRLWWLGLTEANNF